MAVILPNLLNPFFSMVAHYINRALVNRGYRMLLCDTEYDYTKEQEMVQMVAQNKVDGIIALTYNPDLKIPPDVRSVSIDRYLSGSTTCVASDNYNGGRLAAQKLVENGCKNLAFLRIGSPLTSETNKRRDGFVAECEAMQLPCTQKILMDDAPLSEFEHFLEENLKDGRLAFDGIFASPTSWRSPSSRCCAGWGSAYRRMCRSSATTVCAPLEIRTTTAPPSSSR